MTRTMCAPCAHHVRTMCAETPRPEPCSPLNSRVPFGVQGLKGDHAMKRYRTLWLAAPLAVALFSGCRARARVYAPAPVAVSATADVSADTAVVYPTAAPPAPIVEI